MESNGSTWNWNIQTTLWSSNSHLTKKFLIVLNDVTKNNIQKFWLRNIWNPQYLKLNIDTSMFMWFTHNWVCILYSREWKKIEMVKFKIYYIMLFWISLLLNNWKMSKCYFLKLSRWMTVWTKFLKCNFLH